MFLPISLPQLTDAVQVVALGQTMLLSMRRRRCLLIQLLGRITATVAAILLSCLFVPHLRFRLHYDLLPVLLLLLLSGRRMALVRRWVKLVPSRRRYRHRWPVTFISGRGWLSTTCGRLDEILLMEVAPTTIAVSHGVVPLLFARCRSLRTSTGQFTPLIAATTTTLLVHVSS